MSGFSDNSERAMVAEIVRWASTKTGTPPAEQSPKFIDGLSYIYVINAGDACKVGMSQRPDRRIADLQLASFAKLTLVRTFPVELFEARGIEIAAHKALEKTSERRGEWFKVGVDECCRTVEHAIKRYVPPLSNEWRRHVAKMLRHQAIVEEARAARRPHSSPTSRV